MKRLRVKNMNWVILSLLAMVMFTIVFLLIRKITDKGVSAETFLLFNGVTFAVIIAIYVFASKTTTQLGSGVYLWIFLAALASVIGNILLIRALAIAPNPGYALAITGVHIMLVAIISIFLLKAEFSWIKIIGTFLAVVGIILLGL